MASIKRRGDWRARLDAFFDKQIATEFSEEQNCATFAADAVKAITGTDIISKYRSTKTISEGIKALKKDGFDDHVAVAADALEEIHPSEATLGDVVVFEAPDDYRFAFGICIGEQSYVRREDQIGLIPTLTAKRAFRVP